MISGAVSKKTRAADAFKSAFLADPHVARIVYMQLLQFEGEAVVDVVADVFLVGQNRPHCAGIPRKVPISGHAFLVQAVGDLPEGQVLRDQPAILVVDPGRFLVWAGQQDHAVGLQRLVFAALQSARDLAALVHKYPVQSEPSRATLAEAQLDQAALA